MAANPTQIKNDIDAELANKGYRGIRIVNVISALKKLIDWVTGVANTTLSTWRRVGDGQPSGDNNDTVYHVGRTIVGRNFDDGTDATLQVEGYANLRKGVFANNYDGFDPAPITLGGQVVLNFLANWGLPGLSDLALVNTNPISTGIGFWQLTGDDQKRRLLLFLRFGRVGIGTTDPAEALDVVGRVQCDGLVAHDTGLPTAGGQPGNITPSLKAGSTNLRGTLVVATGGNPPANSNLLTVTFTKPYSHPPYVLLSAGSGAAPGGLLTVYVAATSPTGFTLACGQALVANTSFEFTYLVIG